MKSRSELEIDALNFVKKIYRPKLMFLKKIEILDLNKRKIEFTFNFPEYDAATEVTDHISWNQETLGVTQAFLAAAFIEVSLGTITSINKIQAAYRARLLRAYIDFTGELKPGEEAKLVGTMNITCENARVGTHVGLNYFEAKFDGFMKAELRAIAT